MEASTEKKSTIENFTENSSNEAMSNMANNENAPPFTKKWLDQQPQFKGKDGKVIDVTSEESMKEFISQCEQAIKDLEEGLEKKTVPFYMRGISKKLLNTVKMEKEHILWEVLVGHGRNRNRTIITMLRSRVVHNQGEKDNRNDEETDI